MIPSITKVLAACEKWDYIETTIQNEIWRSYIAKLFNLFIFLLLNFQVLFAQLGLEEAIGLSKEQAAAIVETATK